MFKDPAADGPYDAIVIGAGQAGLATSYFLAAAGASHVVLEKDRIGESWRSQRWDSFRLNSPNELNGLPGAPYDGQMPDGFDSARDLVRSFERYAARFDLPVRTGVEVRAVERGDGGDGFIVRTRDQNDRQRDLRARSVVAACGVLRKPKVPVIARMLPEDIVQQHAADYRNPQALPDGAVLIVGSGQSGSQIAEDLNGAGRQVYLCTSRVGRLPRRYRGKDILVWFRETGFMDVARAELADPAICRAAQAQVSGVGRHGHTLSYQSLHRDGVVLLGRLTGVDGTELLLGNDLRDNIRFADRKSADGKQEVDAYVARYGIRAPAPEADPADAPWTDCWSLPQPARLDLRQAGIRSVVWSTGFSGDFSWLRLPVLDGFGQPMQESGIGAVPGIYFVGFPWLSKRKSGIIWGVEEDAAAVARHILDRRRLAA